MELTHELKNNAQAILANTFGYTITTECQSVMIDNNGSDDAKIYFNNDDVNYYLLKAGTALPIRTDNQHEILRDIMKIEFVTTVDPLINILKQNKTMIS